MENGVLPTAFRGYHKMQTLVYIDSLNALNMAVEDGSISAEEAYKSAENIMKKPIAKAFGGFSVPETDAFLNSLVAKLRILAEQQK